MYFCNLAKTPRRFVKCSLYQKITHFASLGNDNAPKATDCQYCNTGRDQPVRGDFEYYTDYRTHLVVHHVASCMDSYGSGS